MGCGGSEPANGDTRPPSSQPAMKESVLPTQPKAKVESKTFNAKPPRNHPAMKKRVLPPADQDKAKADAKAAAANKAKSQAEAEAAAVKAETEAKAAAAKQAKAAAEAEAAKVEAKAKAVAAKQATAAATADAASKAEEAARSKAAARAKAAEARREAAAARRAREEAEAKAAALKKVEAKAASSGSDQNDTQGFYSWCLDNPIVRKSLDDMTDEELKKFMGCVDMMTTNQNGKGTSEFFRVAGYHGYTPTTYCAHKKESFPGWHRLYLHHFEVTLRWFDKFKYGGDGMAFIPYWDWYALNGRNEIGKNMQVVRTWWKEKYGLPDGKIAWKTNRGRPTSRSFNRNWLDLFPAAFAEEKKGFTLCKRNKDHVLLRKMQYKSVYDDANGALTNSKDHLELSSTSGGTETSVEVSHNDVHVSWGGTMGNLKWAGFEIGFWLHHCYVDRLYESGLEQLQGGHKAAQLQMQREGQRKWRKPKNLRTGQPANLYLDEVEPFCYGADGTDNEGLDVLIKTSHDMADTFDTLKNLGYSYPSTQTKEANLTMPPNLVIFDQMHINRFEGKVLDLNIFICKKSEEQAFEKELLECKTVDDALALPLFAGSSSVFGRGAGCNNCTTSPPFDILVNISQAMIKNAIGRKDVCVKAYAVDVTGEDDDDDVDEFGDILPMTIDKLKPAAELKFPEHRLVGTLFEDEDGSLQEGAAVSGEDGAALQRFLEATGYYEGAIDNDLGPKTKTGILAVQKAFQLKEDGIFGPKSKKLIKERRCENKDPGVGKDPWSDAARSSLSSKLSKYGNVVTYSVDSRPVYLAEDVVDGVIEASFEKWADVSGLEFEQIPGPDENGTVQADITFSFANESKDPKNIMRFDGAGGVLGKGGDGFVTLDESERWTCDEKEVSDMFDPSTYIGGKPAVSLQYASLHEIGHALGLDHSNEINHVMSPYYTPKTQTLTEQDISRIQALYGEDFEYGSETK